MPDRLPNYYENNVHIKNSSAGSTRQRGGEREEEDEEEEMDEQQRIERTKVEHDEKETKRKHRKT